PEFSVADSNHEVIGPKTEAAQEIDTERDHLDISVERRFANNVGVELIVLAQPAALLFLVAKAVRDRKPLERLLEFAVVCGDDARQGRRQFGTERDFPFAFVGEIEEL